MRAAVQAVVDVNNLADFLFVLVAEAGTHILSRFFRASVSSKRPIVLIDTKYFA